MNAPSSLPPAALPPALAEKELQRSLWLNIFAGGFGMVYLTAALGMPLPLLMREIGASGLQLGLLSGAWQFSMLAQLIAGAFVERLPARKPFWAGISIIHRALWAVPAVLPILLPGRVDLWAWIIIAALAFSNLLGQAGTAPWQSWMADLIPPARAGRFWGIRHRFLSVSLAVSALGFGWLLDHAATPQHPFLGFQVVFALAATLGIVDIVLHCWVYEPAPHRTRHHGSWWDFFTKPLRQGPFLRFTIGTAVWTGASAMLGYNQGLPGFFSMVYLKEQFGVTYGQAALVFIAAALGGVLWAPRIGHAIDRYGGRRVMCALILLGPLGMIAWWFISPGLWQVAGWSVPRSVGLLGLVSLVVGGLYSGTWMSQVRVTQSLTTPVGRTLAMGFHWGLVGLIGALGPLFAGWMRDHFAAVAPPGAPTYFQALVILHLVLAWGVALPLIWGVRVPQEPALAPTLK